MTDAPKDSQRFPWWVLLIVAPFVYFAFIDTPAETSEGDSDGERVLSRAKIKVEITENLRQLEGCGMELRLLKARIIRAGKAVRDGDTMRYDTEGAADMLVNLSFMIDVEKAQCAVEEDREREIAAVQAGVGSFMCSYNKINGTYACAD